ncbi:hypothetical protein NHQ30_009919 [Ciborinia camelliae]|nr:hypothetical protein NHQ30_009919 [Ciborinia camelliae]
MTSYPQDIGSKYPPPPGPSDNQRPMPYGPMRQHQPPSSVQPAEYTTVDEFLSGPVRVQNHANHSGPDNQAPPHTSNKRSNVFSPEPDTYKKNRPNSSDGRFLMTSHYGLHYTESVKISDQPAPHTSSNGPQYAPDNRVPHTSSNGFQYAADNRAPHTPSNGSHYHDAPDSRIAHHRSNSGPQYPVDHRELHMSSNGSQYHDGPDSRIAHHRSNSGPQYPVDHRAPHTPSNGSHYHDAPDSRIAHHRSNSGPQYPVDNRALYTSRNGSQYPDGPDNRIPHPTTMTELQYSSDNRTSHHRSNSPQYHADNRMRPSSSYNESQHHPPPTTDYHSQAGWNPYAHASNGRPELYRNPSNNGTQNPGHSTAPPQDSRFLPTGYNAPPDYPYPDGRGYTQGQYKVTSPSTESMTFKQSAPRQRTAIACKYCRRRKIRCSGFSDSGSDGRCGNCARFKQQCVFTPVSSQQAFVPLSAVIAANKANGITTFDPNTTPLYGAHGQPIALQAPPPQMFPPPPQSSFDPQLPYGHQQIRPPHQEMARPPHSPHLPAIYRSPNNQDVKLPSPTDSLGSQSRRRVSDEAHWTRLPQPGPGPSSGYKREDNVAASRSVYEDERRSHLPPPAPNQHYGYQLGENVVPHRPIEDNRQLAPVRSNEAPRGSPSPNDLSREPRGNFQLTQSAISPRRSELPPLSRTPPAGPSSGGRRNPMATTQRSDPMSISHCLVQDLPDHNAHMLNRVGQTGRY